MKLITTSVLAASLVLVSPAWAAAPSIEIVDSATPSEELPVKPGVYVGQKITFNDAHNGSVAVRVGVWEAGESKTYLENYPFTEYVLMISGHVVITNDDGSMDEFKAGDTFVIPKGFSGMWDIRERMKKQMVQIGDPSAKPTSRPVPDLNFSRIAVLWRRGLIVSRIIFWAAPPPPALPQPRFSARFRLS